MINWGLGQGPNSFDRAFGTGLQLGQAARQQQAENALSAYATDQSDANFAEVAKYNPRFAIRERERQAEAQQQQQFRDMRRAAIMGDENAARELAVQDNAAYNNFTDEQKAQSDEADKVVANALFQIEQLPENQRSAAWDDVAKQAGADELVGTYSPTAVRVIAAKGGVSKALQAMQKPGIEFVPDGATAYATNPQGESVLRALNGLPPQQPVEQPGPTGGPPPENPNPQSGVTVISSEQIQQVNNAFGGDQAKVQAYLTRNNIAEGKQVNGQTYYKVNGQWFDNPEGR